MARRVYFSFHYDRDVMRVSQVRNSWVVRPGKDAQPFLDKADWEAIKKKGDDAISRWIEEQLKGTSVTVVLIGAETASRRWVKHEIKRSYELGKGMLGVYIHNLKDPKTGTDAKGQNPFNAWKITKNGRDVSFAEIYPTYDWVTDDGYNNLSKWVEDAAAAAGR